MHKNISIPKKNTHFIYCEMFNIFWPLLNSLFLSSVFVFYMVRNSFKFCISCHTFQINCALKHYRYTKLNISFLTIFLYKWIEIWLYNCNLMALFFNSVFIHHNAYFCIFNRNLLFPFYYKLCLNLAIDCAVSVMVCNFFCSFYISTK